MSGRPTELTPLQAYVSAEQQKHRLGQAFRTRILRLHSALCADRAVLGRIPSSLPQALRRHWHEACRILAEAPAGDPAIVLNVYRDIVMRYGLKRIDPGQRSFGRNLREFYRNYVTNFPLPEEQESLQGFRDLWRASPRAGGYQEIGCSVLCPLTGRYIMGVNFTIQPASDSVHFIYGFINPAARGIGGFSTCLIDLMRTLARDEIGVYFAQHPDKQPAFRSDDGPLILFEKNIINEMSLTEILMDTAHVDIERPPRRGARLSTSSISQSVRDFIWDRRGARILAYNYIQSSLDGVVRVPDDARESVIACLNGATLECEARLRAEQALAKGLNGRTPGCTTLNLCAFVGPGRTSVPAAQIRIANEIFQGISVVKQPELLEQDIYFQAQMASLSESTVNGTIALRPILPTPSVARDFDAAEQVTKQLLAGLTWGCLRKHKDRTYGKWLRRAAEIGP